MFGAINKTIYDIRKKYCARMDADETEEEPKKTGNRALPYGLCKGEGIKTTGLTPREAWEAYTEKTGVSPKDAYSDHFTKKHGVDDIKSNPKIRQYMKDTYGMGVSSSFSSSMKGNENIEKLKSVLGYFEDGVSERGDLKELIKNGGVDERSDTVMDGMPFKFGVSDYNTMVLIDADKLKNSDQTIKNLVNDGKVPKNSTLESIAEGEKARLIEGYLIMHSDKYEEGDWKKPSKKPTYREAFSKNLLGREIAYEAFSDLNKDKKYGNWKEMASEVSSRMSDNPISEAFADCKANGKDASPLSKRIKSITLKRYKELRDK